MANAMMPRCTIRFAAIAAPLVLAGCTSAPPHVVPPPVPPPRIAPPPPAPVDWRDQPISPGVWSYTAEPDGSSARYGPPGLAADFTLRCSSPTRQVTLARTGATAALKLTTSYGERIVPAPAGIATLAASDPLLDQLAFSRGHVSIESAGVALLVMPAWAEPARVIEDCRIAAQGR